MYKKQEIQDAYQSGMFGLTTPLYESYMQLKEILL